MNDTHLLLDQVAPATGRLVFPRCARASGVFYSSKAIVMTKNDQRVIALQALHLVRQAIGGAIAHGLLKAVLWISHSETLADCIDRSIAEIEQVSTVAIDEAPVTLRRIKAVLKLAYGSGHLRDTLWAAPHETLFDHIDGAIALLAPAELEAA